VSADRPSTVDLIGLFMAYTAGQAAMVVLLIRLFPGGGS
jgi:cytochrome c oxidase subunit I+III